SVSPVDQNYWIETLVFADYTVRQRFGTLEQAQLYVITLMSLVSEIFKVPSLQISGLRDQRILRPIDCFIIHRWEQIFPYLYAISYGLMKKRLCTSAIRLTPYLTSVECFLIQSNELLWGPSLIRSVHRFCSWSMTNYYVRYNYDHALFLSRNIVQAAGELFHFHLSYWTVFISF
ncbi:hypothetical protein FBUS_02291, partial [Fasciolopsis buskii]